MREAARRALAEDAVDLDALGKRRNEKSLHFGAFVQVLKRVGRL